MIETLGSILAEVAAALAAAGCSQARHRARRLITTTLGLTASELFADPERKILESEARRIRSIVRRLAACEPLSRIVGRREFWGLEFALSADALDPRPDSETVVEAVLRRIPDRDARLRLLDLGTGTGCLLLALLSELPRAAGIGVDIAPGAATTARANAAALGIASRARFFVGEWGEAVAGQFHVVVANPPYIASSALVDLPRAVRGYDPPRALDGGLGGLEAYHAIGTDLRRLLTPDGIFATEIGIGQADAVATMLEGLGLAIDGLEYDLAGVSRCVVGRSAGESQTPSHQEAKKLLECAVVPFRVP
jgi:release factor glutamine methyltransferase